MNSKDYFDEMQQCPVCQEMVAYGDMIWLDGMCTCPRCYNSRRNRLQEECNQDEKNCTGDW